jgi:hypothetical protein
MEKWRGLRHDFGHVDGISGYESLLRFQLYCAFDDGVLVGLMLWWGQALGETDCDLTAMTLRGSTRTRDVDVAILYRNRLACMSEQDRPLASGTCDNANAVWYTYV